MGSRVLITAGWYYTRQSDSFILAFGALSHPEIWLPIAVRG